MKRVLFVDDEPNVLAGLRRMLRGLRGQWDMEFVESGPEALRRLAERPFDVVVTDMRMPGMDGSQLLGEVVALYPATVRIVLSGQCVRDSVLQVVGPAHQFLTKPCEAETLRATVGRACRLRDQLCDERYRQLASRVRTLGSRPEVFEQLVAELRRPDASIQRAGEIVACDLGASLRILQLVNSGFFGTPRRVTDPARAVNLLGLDVLRPLVLDIGAIAPLAVDGPVGEALETVFEQAVAAAAAARDIARRETGDESAAADAYLGGLLRDVGVLVFAQEHAARYEELLAAASRDGVSLWETEKRCYSATHAELGAYLAALWGLPDAIVECIALHHAPSPAENDGFSALAAVHAAGTPALQTCDGSHGLCPAPSLEGALT
jgi:HD-like signal output (HDOD) protein